WENKKIFNKLISKIRYKVERTFGNLHQVFCIGETPYVGNRKTDYFLKMKAIVYNLKGFIKLEIVQFAG
ncbi:MAG: transposase, partial [Candidatus Cloacimonetes bacterium]|nr:transposase [Candidatus Cloacimonadota bacterium]